MGHLFQDLRYALRSFAKNPGFAVAAILSLALGIGANATIFSIANAILNRHLPVKDPQTLVSLYWGGKGGEGEFSYPDYADIRDKNQVFESVAAFCPLTAFSLSASSEPERVWGQVVTGNFFETTGVRPILGRSFMAEEDKAPGRNPVAILGYSLWQRSFGGDPGIVGKKIVLNKHTFTVVGVAPEGFHGTFLGVMPELWIPTMMQPVAIPGGDDMLGSRGNHWLDIVARLKPGVTDRQAQQAMFALARNNPESYGPKPDDSTVLLRPVSDVHPMMRTGVLTFIAALTVVVGLVLLIACANVANLLLARATARQKEIAIRMALGAGRTRLIRQLITESILLALAGGIGGVLLADWAGSALNGFHLPLPMPINFRVGVDVYVLGYTFVLAIATGLIFGLSPAIHATRTDVQSALKDEVTGGRWRRFGARNVLVVAQVALSVVLLTGTGLFLRSLQHAHGVDIGFNPDHLLMFSVDPNVQGYSEEESKTFYKELEARLAATPGVRSATVTEFVPLSFSGSATLVGTTSGEKVELVTDLYMVSPGYFRTLGIPILRGRGLQNDTAKTPRVAVVNERFAERLWPGKDAIGQTFGTGGHRYQVVGIAKNTKSRSLGEVPKPIFYEAIDQNYSKGNSRFGMTVLVKTTGDPGSMAASARQVVRTLDATLAVFNVETMDKHMVNALFLPRVAATLFGVFGVVGMLLASVGLYGVLNFAVSRRTHEFGIRIAIGADIRNIRLMVLRQGLSLACAGLVLGLAAAAAVAQLASSLLFGISAMDTVTFVAVPAILLGVAGIATAIPAWRATRVDPMVALRYQ
jgi:predicted permease